jgi:hypothetical protein
VILASATTIVSCYKGEFDEHAERQRRAEVDDGVHGGTAVRRGVTS